MIELNCDKRLKLPYIFIPELDANFMVDTGSMRSFIRPEKAREYFPSQIVYEPFEVVSTHATSKHSEVIQIPLPPTFGSPQMHKFYLFNVDSRYDGLIGIDLLTQINAVVDLKHRVLKTDNVTIPIIQNFENYSIDIPARSEIRVKIPTDLHTGEGILNYTELGNGVRMPSALVSCVNGYATTIIQNTLEEDMELQIKSPFQITEYNPSECRVNAMTDQNDLEIDKILTENLQKLRLDHMNEEERMCISKLCEEYKDIFYSEELPLTFTNHVKHFIRTKHEDPIYTKPYRQAPAQAEEVKQQVEKLLQDNVIQESHSPWSSPVHLVPKKIDASGIQKYRMVIDFRRLNEITIDDRYPLPNITDLFDKLGKSTYFTTLDLASGYHQIEVNPSDIPKTAFSTQFGHYEFLRMPFGLKTAPATFQRAMDSILRGLQGIHCLVYLDDIIIFSSSLQEHIQKLRTVFDRLRETNLKVQLNKSEFLRKEILYLGHKITKDGLKPNDDKIKAVLNFPLPRTTTQIKSFLGLVGYYRRFIKDFSKITHPLTSCLKKRNKIVIDQKYIDSFEKCKELLTTAPLLQYPDFDRPFLLTTDASAVALGAVLSQGPVGSDKPIAYASRTLSDTESRYSTIERELLAIVWAVKHFRPYLYGRKFILYTDHRPLAWIHSLKEPNSKLTRWRLRLQEYQFDTIYKKGKQNSNADALSRIPVNALDSDMKQESIIVNISDESDAEEKPISISSSTSTAPESLALDNEDTYPLPSISSSRTETAHSGEELESHGIPILREAIDTKPNQIIVYRWFKDETQVKDLSRPKQKVLEIFIPENNEELIKQFLLEYVKPKGKYFIYFETETLRKNFAKVIIYLFKSGTVEFFECTERVIYVEDEKEQEAIIRKLHQGKTCHRGIKETMVRIRRNYFWNNMQETVSAVLNDCELCRRMKYDRKPIKPTLQLTQTQDAPFQEVFIDLFTIENKHYLTLVDAFSKLGQAIEISNRSAPEIVRSLIKYFSFYGAPRKISCDPGTEFNNELLKEMLKYYKIELHITTPNNPNSTGIVERFHSTLIEIYRLAKYEQKCTDAASVMTYSIMAYNHTIHSATGLTPFEVVFGHTDSSTLFNTNVNQAYTQRLVKDHAKRTKFLYKYISQKLLREKEKVKEKRGGENDVELSDNETVFVKDINVRKSKEKPRYKRAKIKGKPERNVVPVLVGMREMKAPIKNVKRPPQVLPGRPGPSDEERGPGPSTAKD